jgi:hypothetical protein
MFIDFPKFPVYKNMYLGTYNIIIYIIYIISYNTI